MHFSSINVCLSPKLSVLAAWITLLYLKTEKKEQFHVLHVQLISIKYIQCYVLSPPSSFHFLDMFSFLYLNFLIFFIAKVGFAVYNMHNEEN
jgi:hypothetical protein